jgi:hypothetical protein
MRHYLDCPAKRDIWEKVKDKLQTAKYSNHLLRSFFKEDKSLLVDVNTDNCEEAKVSTGSSSSAKEVHFKRTIFKDHDILCFVVNPVF